MPNIKTDPNILATAIAVAICNDNELSLSLGGMTSIHNQDKLIEHVHGIVHGLIVAAIGPDTIAVHQRYPHDELALLDRGLRGSVDDPDEEGGTSYERARR